MNCRLRAALLPALLIVLTLFLFLPFTIYKGNIEEFVVGLAPLLFNLSLPGAALFALLVIIAALLPSRAHRLWIALLFSLGVLVWVEGSIIIWDYGKLDGNTIDWSIYGSRALLDGAVWIAIIALSLFFSKKVQKKASLVCAILIAIQFAYFGFFSIANAGVWKNGNNNSQRAPDEIFEFSKTKNVIHVVLDQFQSDIFQSIINEDPKRYYKALEGFTFFKETTSSFQATIMSIPTIFSGEVYKNDTPMRDYTKKLLKSEKTIFGVLHKNGYEIDRLHGTGQYKAGRYSNYYRVPIPYGVSQKLFIKTNLAILLDLVLFRAAPHHLKESIYNDQLWLLQRMVRENYRLSGTFDTENVFGVFAHRTFLKDLTKQMTLGREKPVYKFIHLLESHGPLVLDKDCGFAGQVMLVNIENVRNQQRCALNNFIDFLEKLKKLGIYDSSLIVVNSDHGSSAGRVAPNGPKDYRFYVLKSAAMALMAVKPPASKGPLKISLAQTELTDIPATISHLLGLENNFSGRAAYTVSPKEVRKRYYHYAPRPMEKAYYIRLDQYIIEGSVFDNNSWKIAASYHKPGTTYHTKKIDFGTTEADWFLRSGWGGIVVDAASNMTLISISDHTSSLFLSFPKEAVELKLILGQNGNTRPIVMAVKVDGKQMGGKALINSPGNLINLNFTVPADPKRPEISILEFKFSEYFGGKKITDAQSRLALESLTIGPK